MIITILFLATFCIFFFLPVNFRIYYRKVAWDDLLIFEMNFLNGLVKRRKVISLIKPTSDGNVKKEKRSGRWFFLKKSQVKVEETPRTLSSRDLREFLQKFQHFGLGITLLFYFLPDRYQRWLLVAGDLEKKGNIQRFIWRTRYGTGEAAGTSILYGVFWGLKASLVKYLQNRVGFARTPILEITPDYRDSRWDTVFDCIFRIKLGYIILASIIARLRLRLLKGGVF